jgi:hypothetical protein
MEINAWNWKRLFRGSKIAPIVDILLLFQLIAEISQSESGKKVLARIKSRNIAPKLNVWYNRGAKAEEQIPAESTKGE